VTILDVRNLVKRFGGLTAIDGLSFSVEEGQIHGLIGPNGAGKTTTFNVVSGLYAPDSGDILLAGESISGLPMQAIAARGAIRSFQHSVLFHEMTLLENVLVGCHLRRKAPMARLLWRALSGRDEALEKDRAHALEVLDFFDLAGRKDDLAGELPHGLQRALGMAVAFAATPRLLMLDEPFTGMNPEETAHMMSVMRKLQRSGITILLVEHDMRAIMGLCERITVLNFGSLLAAGSSEEIRRHPKVIEAYLGSGHAS